MAARLGVPPHPQTGALPRNPFPKGDETMLKLLFRVLMVTVGYRILHRITGYTPHHAHARQRAFRSYPRSYARY